MPTIEVSKSELFVLKLALEDRAAKTAGAGQWPAHEAAMLLRVKLQEA